jgi:hypothetical protein
MDEFHKLSPGQQLRVDAYILGAFAQGDEAFIDTLQQAVKAVFDNDITGLGGSIILDEVRNDLAKNVNRLPRLSSDQLSADHAQIQDRLQTTGNLLAQEYTEQRYHGAERYATIARAFFEQHQGLQPSAQHSQLSAIQTTLEGIKKQEGYHKTTFNSQKEAQQALQALLKHEPG